MNRLPHRSVIALVALVGLPAAAGAATGPGLPLSTFDTADFSGSGNCAVCHSQLRDAAGNDVSIDTHWRATMMANSAREPLWQAKVSSEVARNPALRSVIEAKCATCHMPMAYTQALTDGLPVAVLDTGFLDPAHPLHQSAMDGVACTLCHQIQPDNLGTAPSFTGHYEIDTASVPPNRMIFGPFPNPLVGPMRNQSGFTPVHGVHVLGSGLCGTCHTLYTPYVDAQGLVLGTFPEQTPYLEWLHSDYGDGVLPDRSCQECHMPYAVGGVAISNGPRRLAPREPFVQHTFVGANSLLLSLLRDNVPELGLTVSSTQLQSQVNRTNAQLDLATAALDVLGAAVEGDRLVLTLKVRNLAGHKLPSGFPSRRVWLHTRVSNASGATVFESGALQRDGRILGNDADTDPAGMEPHHDVIGSPEQVQIYEAVMLNTDRQVTYTLLRAASYGKDNRLLPAGFDKSTAHPDVAVYGGAAADSNFDGSGDVVQYRVPLNGTTGRLDVVVEMLYQTIGYRFARDLGQDATPLTQRFAALYVPAAGSAAVLDTVRVSATR